MLKNTGRALLPVLLLLLLPLPIAAESFDRDRLAGARAALLQAADSGDILFAWNPDRPLAPASLTKLVTLHLIYNRITAEKLGVGQVVAIPPYAAWRSQEAGSSLMFLEPGQRVTVGELMQGLAVSSGNDAAAALAGFVAGSVSKFVELMNLEMGRLGYSTLRFVDPSGLSAGNSITAREFAAFCGDYIRLHPAALKNLHARKSFTYPLPDNLPPAAAGEAAREGGDLPAWPAPGSSPPPIRQNNFNLLLWEYPGLDGLKTGYIDEAGYNIAATARRNGMRLIAVVLGIQAPDHLRGGRLRADAAAALLDYGFENFITLRPEPPPLKEARVWKGRRRTVTPVLAEELVFTIPRALQTDKLTFETRLESRLIAPVQAGRAVGELTIRAGGRVVRRCMLLAGSDVERGGFFRRLIDSLRLHLDAFLDRLSGGRRR